MPTDFHIVFYDDDVIRSKEVDLCEPMGGELMYMSLAIGWFKTQANNLSANELQFDLRLSGKARLR